MEQGKERCNTEIEAVGWFHFLALPAAQSLDPQDHIQCKGEPSIHSRVVTWYLDTCCVLYRE